MRHTSSSSQFWSRKCCFSSLKTLELIPSISPSWCIASIGAEKGDYGMGYRIGDLLSKYEEAQSTIMTTECVLAEYRTIVSILFIIQYAILPIICFLYFQHYIIAILGKLSLKSSKCMPGYSELHFTPILSR
jgi:hypothetical protein